ncbi:hypothetical protein OROMI_034989 [Orobanche minor]
MEPPTGPEPEKSLLGINRLHRQHHTVQNAALHQISAAHRQLQLHQSYRLELHQPTESGPSTPVRDTDTEAFLASNKKLPESVWPSTLRSLSISFQSDKREETFPSERTLRPSLNVARKISERPPSRKRSPLKGMNSVDQFQNSKPVVDSLLQSGKRNDVADMMKKDLFLSRPRMITVTPPVRKSSLDGPLKKSASDLLMLISRDESGIEAFYGNSVDDRLLRTRRPRSSTGVSPSRAKVVKSSSRGTSPARVRPYSPSRNPQSSTSVLSFIADIKKGPKAANNIEDVHELRLLYNKHLQWRFASARTDAALRSQKEKAERMLYSVLRIIVDLWNTVREKRSDLLQLKLKLKLYSVLDTQMTFLDEWTSMERDHTNSLTCAIRELQTSAVRIPVTGGARVDIRTLKAAVCSAVDVMGSMGSSLCSILSQVEGMNCLVSELADVAARERAKLDECGSLLDSTAALQVKEHSLRTHLLQMKQAWENGQQPLL